MLKNNWKGDRVMKLIIDDANIEKIKEIYEYFPVDGITTNPTILYKSGREPYEILKNIRNFIGNHSELHVQVISRAAKSMVEEAKKICKELGQETYVKIPTTREGLKAMQVLSKENVKITATAVYTTMQAYLAGKSGADYIAPYVNRIDNLGANGIETTKAIHNILKNNGLKSEVLAASFKNSQQIMELCEYGIGAATVGTEIIERLIKNATVESAVDAFIQDFEALCGQGKTMLNC